MQKLVKGATKPKNMAPKAKYVEPILASTYEGGHDFEVVMESLAKAVGSRSAWPTVYKALIMVHIMIREGAEDIVLKYISRHSHMLEIDDPLHRAPVMGRYAKYLHTRGQQFKATRTDYIRFKTKSGFSKLHNLTVDKGLMRECSSVLVQLEALLRCQYEEQDVVRDDVLLMAFRLLVHDALSLFQVLNEGVINLLEHFFELSKADAEQALDIYRGFRRLTAKVIAYLRTAKNLEYKTMLHVPNIKHAPTSLVSSLEMYLNDPEFEQNRKHYLEDKQQHQIKRSQSTRRPSSQPAPKPVVSETPALAQQQQLAQQLQVQNSIFTPQPAAVQQFDSNPFWQAQQESAQIQSVDTQAQAQMLQLRQLQQQQVEQQERVRQQIAQLERQSQQNEFDFGFQGQGQGVQAQTTGFTQMQAQTTGFAQNFAQNGFAPQSTGFSQPQAVQPQAVQPVQHMQQPVQSMPIQPVQSIQPVHLQQQPVQHLQQPVQSMQVQSMQPVQPPVHLQPTNDQFGMQTEHNPFKRLTASETGTNPFKQQLSALDSVGQVSLIDFGQPQATGTNPFRSA